MQRMALLAALLTCAFAFPADPPTTGPATEKRFPPLRVPEGFRATLFASDPLIEYPSAIALEDGDSVAVDQVLPLTESYYVSVSGMIQKPGRYPWHEGMKLKDLVFLARGPKVGADLREGEIARLPADRSTGQLATTIRVPLDSSYLFERDAQGRYAGAAGVPFPAAGSAPEVTLEPFDNVLILRQPQFEMQRSVAIVGAGNERSMNSLCHKS